MSRYIDADDLMAEIRTTIEDSGCVNHEGEILDCITYAPTADVAPVVRCKECKFRAQFTDGHSECRLWPPVPMSYRTVANDDYCSRGARMGADK